MYAHWGIFRHIERQALRQGPLVHRVAVDQSATLKVGRLGFQLACALDLGKGRLAADVVDEEIPRSIGPKDCIHNNTEVDVLVCERLQLTDQAAKVKLIPPGDCDGFQDRLHPVPRTVRVFQYIKLGGGCLVQIAYLRQVVSGSLNHQLSKQANPSEPCALCHCPASSWHVKGSAACCDLELVSASLAGCRAVLTRCMHLASSLR